MFKKTVLAASVVMLAVAPALHAEDYQVTSGGLEYERYDNFEAISAELKFRF